MFLIPFSLILVLFFMHMLCVCIVFQSQWLDSTSIFVQYEVLTPKDCSILPYMRYGRIRLFRADLRYEMRGLVKIEHPWCSYRKPYIRLTGVQWSNLGGVENEKVDDDYCDSLRD
jgi:hypothetical protein